MKTIRIQVISYGIAREIIGAKKTSISLSAPLNIGSAKQFLLETYPKFNDLVSLSFAVDDEYRADDYELTENDELIIIPPVSGG